MPWILLFSILCFWQIAGLAQSSASSDRILVIQHQTYLKETIKDASELAEAEKCVLPQGTRLVIRDRPLFVTDNHYWIKILEGSPCGTMDSGYVFGPHAGIRLDRASLITHGASYLKLKVQDADRLQANEKCLLPKNTVLDVTSQPILFSANHFRITVASLDGASCPGFREAYIYGPHVGLSHPTGLGYRVQTATVFKARIAQGQALSPSEKCSLPLDSVIVVGKPIQHARENHAQVTILSLHHCPFTSGYIYAPHLGVDFLKAIEAARLSGEFGAGLVSQYRAKYQQVKNTVGFTHNGCAAFASTALRMVGVNIPYMTFAPSLADTLGSAGWIKVKDHRALKPGDLVFTRDWQTTFDGYTNHVFVFAGYAGDTSVGYAIDNQGNGYQRALNNSSKYSVFWFAYRHP